MSLLQAFVVAFSVAMAVLTSGPQPTSAVAMPIYAAVLQNVGYPGYCLKVTGASSIGIATCDLETLEQTFDYSGYVNYQTTAGFLKFNSNGKRLQVVGAGTGNGAAIEIATAAGGNNQLWSIINGVAGVAPNHWWEGPHQIQNVNSGRCLTLEGIPGINGVLDQYDCVGQSNAPHQTWRVVQYPRVPPSDWTSMLKSVAYPTNCLDNLGSNSASGATVGLFLCTPSAPNQHWTFDPTPSLTSYAIRNKATGNCAQVNFEGTADATAVTMMACTTEVYNYQPQFWWNYKNLDPFTQSETTRRIYFEAALAPGKALTEEVLGIYSDIYTYTNPPHTHQMFYQVTPAQYKKPFGGACYSPIECLSASCASGTCQTGVAWKGCQAAADCTSNCCNNGKCC